MSLKRPSFRGKYIYSYHCILGIFSGNSFLEIQKSISMEGSSKSGSGSTAQNYDCLMFILFYIPSATKSCATRFMFRCSNMIYIRGLRKLGLYPWKNQPDPQPCWEYLFSAAAAAGDGAGGPGAEPPPEPLAAPLAALLPRHLTQLVHAVLLRHGHLSHVSLD